MSQTRKNLKELVKGERFKFDDEPQNVYTVEDAYTGGAVTIRKAVTCWPGYHLHDVKADEVVAVVEG
jgi:hypothetical protein